MAAQRDDDRLQGRGSLRSPAEVLAWKLWRTLYSRPGLYRLFTRLATRLRALTPRRMGGWTRYRSAPRPAKRSLAELARREGFDGE